MSPAAWIAARTSCVMCSIRADAERSYCLRPAMTSSKRALSPSESQAPPRQRLSRFRCDKIPGTERVVWPWRWQYWTKYSPRVLKETGKGRRPRALQKKT